MGGLGAIADHQHLFITNAYLTGYAYPLNMEMGLARSQSRHRSANRHPS